MSVVFEARFPGQCDACDERIYVGEPVTHNEDDALIHDYCMDMTTPANRPEPAPCVTCWLVHVGQCDQ